MSKTIVLDGVAPTQVVLMKDPKSDKVLVQATYRVTAGASVVKTVMDCVLTFPPAPDQKQSVPDLMSSSEQAAAATTWSAVQAALQRLEL